MQLGLNQTASCTLCPRQCRADRSGMSGFCGASDRLEVSSVCLHRGEEPPINPIVNVFFSHCNLQCIYCQNGQISGRMASDNILPSSPSDPQGIDTLADRIASLLPQSKGLLGLVTAAHYADLIAPLLDRLHQRGLEPTVVYNSSGYESVTTLRSLEGLIDIYLPDFKYMDSALAATYSHAPDYPQVAQAAIREMRRQVGGNLKTDADGTAYRGLIVRHLVLPGAIDNSIQCLDWLADEFPFGLHLSLMAQYFPPNRQMPSPLDRCLSADEYASVVDHAVSLGLTDGWIQSLDAENNYRPDFTHQDNPFEQ